MQIGVKSNNPANINSATAKAKGLGYWEYMAKRYPGCVQNFVWGERKRKEGHEDDAPLMSRIMAHPKFKWIKGLLGRRAAY